MNALYDVKIEPYNLNTNTLDSKPIFFDWYCGENYEKWEVIPPRPWEEIEDEDDSSEDDYMPMMNYHYPIAEYDIFDDEKEVWECAVLIDHLPLVIVRIYMCGYDANVYRISNGMWNDYEDYHYSLALTGGGMDMSWDICEAFMLLGIAPPVHFCRLPDMEGIQHRKNYEEIMESCQYSLHESAKRAEMTIKKLHSDIDYLDNIIERN